MLGVLAPACGPALNTPLPLPAEEECRPRPTRWVLAEASDRDVLAAWCENVGPPVLTAPADTTPPAIDSLLVVTWNVRVGGGDLLALVEDLRAGRLTGAPADHFVLLLQEAHRAGPAVPVAANGRGLARRIAPGPPAGERLDVVEVARRLELGLFYVPSMRNGASPDEPPEDRGNAILSTLPLADPHAIELPFEVQRRVAAVARVAGVTSDGQPWTLRVATAHLDHRSPWTRILDTFGAGRARQARGLMRALAPDRPTILGADLNTWAPGPLERALPVLEQHFSETPRDQRLPTHTAARVLPIGRLDHLLFRLGDRQHARVRRIDHRYGSDHYPLLGWVRFSAGPGGPR
jgi:endonuclease/exonuclease/phosphatase family metal-dependent hydrolase